MDKDEREGISTGTGSTSGCEPPTLDVEARTKQFADSLRRTIGAGIRRSHGGDIDARWEDAESGRKSRPLEAAQPLPARTTWIRWARRWALPTATPKS